MADVTIVIPHARAPRWLQICLYSLLSRKNDIEYEVWIINNLAENKTVDAVMKTRLSEDPRIVIKEIPFQEMRTPALALDYSIDYVQTKWLFSAETDIRFVRDNWLDWYFNYVRDEEVGIVGWYWQLAPDEHDTRHYISPSATLYNMNMLRALKAECVANQSLTISYGPNYSQRRPIVDTGDVAHLIESQCWGPFAERRGFFHDYPVPGPQGDAYRNETFWHDTGSWLYRRAVYQWECQEIPGQWIKQAPNNCPPVKHTYYGDSEQEAYLYHYWAGTVSHDFEKHEVGGWAADCVEWWLRREHALWLEYVPEDIRIQGMECGAIPDFQGELDYALSRIRR